MSLISVSPILVDLKKAILDNEHLELLTDTNETTNSITESTLLKINGVKYNLDEATNFTDKNLTLRIIYHCWLNKDTSAADYLKDCKEKKLQNVSFLIRTDLINWLSGVNENSKYIGQLSQSTKTTKEGVQSTVSDKNLSKEGQAAGSGLGQDIEISGDASDFKSHVHKNERILVDHNSLLRGTKLVDFTYLVKQSEGLLKELTRDISKLKKPESNAESKLKTAGVDKNVTRQSAANKDPIIIIPSSASSVITMANIQEFLNKGQYISSNDLPEAENDILKISKKFDITKQNDTANVVVGKNIRFNVVNNTRMFVKPEYWERVVAIIVNGQEWQFDDYMWSNPEELFKHCNGVFFGINGETIPKSIEKWNVGKYYLDKNKTYRNLETCNLFWEDVKRVCIKKGILKE
ncbi:hypothetical protein QEN19_002651 [Hanseniaspora menglaensis]